MTAEEFRALIVMTKTAKINLAKAIDAVVDEIYRIIRDNQKSND